jgi:inorganic triphosphatase YgiF
MATEAELKLRLAPGDHAALAASPALAAVRPQRQRLTSVYFDTPACEIAAAGMVLRLRRSGRRWIPGLKAGNSAGAGLHVRQEWEYPRRDAVLDLARFADTPLAGLKDAAHLHERLVPAFRVDVKRTTWTLEPAPGARLEVALDAGVVESGGRTEAISEVEIECMDGGVDGAYDLALRLLDDVGLHPSSVTKAERGYRLYRREPAQPVKAAPIELAAALTPTTAARRIVAAGLAQVQANEEGVLASKDPEFVHQARIALRRTRSALRMFRGSIGEPQAKAWRDALGEVAAALGVARDWDVFATDTFGQLAAAHGDAALRRRISGAVARERKAARATARAALGSPAYARAMIELSRWIAHEGDDSIAPQALRDFAAATLGKRHKRLLRDAAELASLAPAERHRVRIDAKRLRYGTDALESLFKPRRVRAHRKALEALQDALGATNDAATAATLLPKLHAPEEFAAFARGWLAARAKGDAALLESLIAGLADAPRFWER